MTSDRGSQIESLISEMVIGGGGAVSERPLPFSARYRRSRRGGGVMSLNLTPMIDVVFLLLFFFLAVSRFRGTEGMLPAELPRQSVAVATEVPRAPIRIRLIEDEMDAAICRVRIEQIGEPRIMPIAELSASLRAIRDPQRGLPGFDARTPVHLIADDRVRWDHVVNAYNAALAAEYERVFFAGAG